LKTYVYLSGVKTEISSLVKKLVWSGSYDSIARTLDIDYISSSTDYYVPKYNIPLGTMVLLTDDAGNEVFRGYVFQRERQHSDNVTSLTAYDGAIYLKKNDGYYNFKSMTAESIAAQVCKDLGIQTGTLAETGVTQSKICFGDNTYKIIMMAYTDASKVNGKKYMPIMMYGKLNVIEKGAVLVDYKLKNGVTLLDSTYAESIENMVNKVSVFDSNGNNVTVLKNADLISKFGQSESILVMSDNQTKAEATNNASKLIKDEERKATVLALGNLKCISGYSIGVQDEYTGLIGKFYIDNDTHTWQEGVYKMTLSLSFENIMDEAEYTERVNKSKSATDGLVLRFDFPEVNEPWTPTIK
jgi:hypothetical protein